MGMDELMDELNVLSISGPLKTTFNIKLKSYLNFQKEDHLKPDKNIWWKEEKVRAFILE